MQWLSSFASGVDWVILGRTCFNTVAFWLFGLEYSDKWGVFYGIFYYYRLAERSKERKTVRAGKFIRTAGLPGQIIY